MSGDMPGPWDAECAILYVNIQWQSLAIVGNRVAVVGQSSGNRTIPEMGTQLSRGIRNRPGNVGVVSRRMCPRTKARDLQHVISAQMLTRWQLRLCGLQGAESDHHAFVLHLRVRRLSMFTDCHICSEIHLPSSSMCPPCASKERLHLSLRFMSEVLVKFESNLRANRHRRARYSSRVSFLLAGHRFSWSLKSLWQTIWNSPAH